MRLSKFFLPTLKETPADAAIVSHQLMLRAGMIRQESAGIYSWLPLGLRVLKKVEEIVREEQDRAGAVEMLMPTIQSAELWRLSGRYDDYGDEMLRIRDRMDREMLFGPTNEEMITSIFANFCRSYKDLPKLLYHIQWKFRDERRPRFGVMRGREFLMKDTYSFDLTEEDAKHSYNRMFVAYLNTFARMGLRAFPMKAETGPIGGDLSHEFIILAENGESEVFCHRDLLDLPAPGLDVDFDGDLQSIVDERTQFYAATEDVHDEQEFAKIPEDKRVSARGIEVGQVFYFGTKYSEPMKARVSHPEMGEVPVHMGSYGIGVSRIVGGLIEAFNDDAGIIWPRSVAPFAVGILSMRPGDGATDAACDSIYEKLQQAGLEPLYDDTKTSAGAKFSKMDLIGLPDQIIVGPRGLAEGKVEVKDRATGERIDLSPDQAVANIINRHRHSLI